MYFGLSEEQKSLEENLSKFLSDNAPFGRYKSSCRWGGSKKPMKSIKELLN
jgi:hypothetical protein